MDCYRHLPSRKRKATPALTDDDASPAAASTTNEQQQQQDEAEFEAISLAIKGAVEQELQQPGSRRYHLEIEMGYDCMALSFSKQTARLSVCNGAPRRPRVPCLQKVAPPILVCITRFVEKDFATAHPPTFAVVVESSVTHRIERNQQAYILTERWRTSSAQAGRQTHEIKVKQYSSVRGQRVQLAKELVVASHDQPVHPLAPQVVERLVAECCASGLLPFRACDPFCLVSTNTQCNRSKLEWVYHLPHVRFSVSLDCTRVDGAIQDCNHTECLRMLQNNINQEGDGAWSQQSIMQMVASLGHSTATWRLELEAEYPTTFVVRHLMTIFENVQAIIYHSNNNGIRQADLCCGLQVVPPALAVYATILARYFCDSILGIASRCIPWAPPPEDVQAALAHTTLRCVTAEDIALLLRGGYTGIAYPTQPRPRDMHDDLRLRRTADRVLTPKADGHECLLIASTFGFILQLRCGALLFTHRHADAPATFVIEGELCVLRGATGGLVLMPYDICVTPAGGVSGLPYQERLRILRQVCHDTLAESLWACAGLAVEMKPFLALQHDPYAAVIDCLGYMRRTCERVPFDGLVVCDTRSTYTDRERLVKIKFNHTVDARFVRVGEGVHGGSLYQVLFREHTETPGEFWERSIHTLLHNNTVHLPIVVCVPHAAQVTLHDRVVEMHMRFEVRKKGVQGGEDAFVVQSVQPREANKLPNFVHAVRNIMQQAIREKGQSLFQRIRYNGMWHQQLLQQIRCFRWACLHNVGRGVEVVVDVGAGCGGDLHRWCAVPSLRTLLVVEPDAENLRTYQARLPAHDKLEADAAGNAVVQLHVPWLRIVFVQRKALEVNAALHLLPYVGHKHVLVNSSFSIAQIVSSASQWRAFVGTYFRELLAAAAAALSVTMHITMHSYSGGDLERLVQKRESAVAATVIHRANCRHPSPGLYDGCYRDGEGGDEATMTTWCSSPRLLLRIEAARQLGKSLQEAALSHTDLTDTLHRIGLHTRVVHAYPPQAGEEAGGAPHWLLRSLVFLEVTAVVDGVLRAPVVRGIDAVVAIYRQRLRAGVKLCLLILESDLVVVYDLHVGYVVKVLGYLTRPTSGSACVHIYTVYRCVDPRRWRALKRRGSCVVYTTKQGHTIEFTTTRH